MSRRRSVCAAVAAAALSSTLAGCGLGNGLYNVDLPGGADLGSHPYTVTAEFRDAEDLVPQAGVKVNDVSVGRVSTIRLNRAGTTAEVDVELNGSVQLPANAVASIQQTSLLGEKYVSLSSPLDAAGTGRLRAGAVIPVSRTSDGVQVEQVLGALSMLLNGGGVGQLNEIEHELNQFTGGNEQQIRNFLASASRVITTLAAHRNSINRALTSLATLSGTLRQQNGHIRTVLSSLAPGITVIASQRRQLIAALNALNNLSTVTVTTLKASKNNIVADLRALAPILGHLAAADSALPRSLQELLTFPFSDGATRSIKGDYLNTYATLLLRTTGGKTYPSVPLTRSDIRRTPTHNASARTPALSPSGLLPATSSVAAGLPGTVTVTPDPSTTAGAEGGR